MEMTPQPIAKGLTAEQWVGMLQGDKAKKAKKALNYLDGHQEAELERLLSDPYKGRRGWKSRGIIPRTRNLTKMIVEKSAQLFKDRPPSFEVYQDGSSDIDQNESQAFMDELHKTEWQEFFINVDEVVRLLKTAIVLIQYNDEDQRIELEVLHRGNCAVMVNPVNRAIEALIYITSEQGGHATYRVITDEMFIDLMETGTGTTTTITIVDRIPNPYGMVPAVAFHDTTIPRSGFWNETPGDLIGVNELFNLHITDSEYAISWAKLPTLFMIDCDVVSDGVGTMEVVEEYGSPLPRNVPTEQVYTGGPSRAISLASNGQGTPSVQYLAPVVNIEPLDKVVEGWVKSYAADWSVRIKSAGEGQASSGFQLVVEELPNLELRKQRQRMFENGFKRFYRVFKRVMLAVGNTSFTEGSELFAVFPDPILPTDTKQQEEIWSVKIKEGRASVIDYLRETKGMTTEEAEAKWEEIKQYNDPSDEPSTDDVDTDSQNIPPDDEDNEEVA